MSENKAAPLQVKVERVSCVRRKGQAITTIELVAPLSNAEQLAALPEKFRLAYVKMLEADVMTGAVLGDEIVAETFAAFENEGPGDEAFLQEKEVALEGARLRREKKDGEVRTWLAFKVKLAGYEAGELSKARRVGTWVWIRIG